MEKPFFINEKQNFTLYKANCIDFLGQLPENSVDMIFADPPYFLSSGSFTCQSGKMVSVKKAEWDLSNGTTENLNFHRTWIEACKKILKPNGTIWISGTYHSIYQCGFALQFHNFHILNDIAWFKPNASPNLSCRFFTASHETLIWARKDKNAKHTFHYEGMKNGRFPGDEFKKPNLQMRSVWSVNTPKPAEKKFGKHPTQKPLELLKRIILVSTNPGDTVLDPFTGSSTTGLMAYATGRKFIGIDIEEQYLDLSVKRFEALKKNTPNNENKSKQQTSNSINKNITRFEATRLLQETIGKDLRELAEENGIIVFKDGKLNKGWAGLTLEKALGIGNNSRQTSDGDSWELKLVPLVKKDEAWRVKETMAITMINPDDVLEKPFEESHLFQKMKKMIICGRERKDKEESSSRLLYVNSFDLVSSRNHWNQIKKDYELVRNTIKTEGFDSLTGRMGKFIQPRTKGSGHGSKTRAFYARVSFVEIILGIQET
uniref:Methyltransferase n=1 Tax=Candidatus Kentrum sp. TUN TaxID=2126343 RepID=A0A450ZSC7_9GAMM|nr:MAG: DNA modification methylase [Candidatus Kentron sp. TUN]VFK63403.1 MAG: DNA modification methylase [Candidatus Kentron sp. TUN]